MHEVTKKERSLGCLYFADCCLIVCSHGDNDEKMVWCWGVQEETQVSSTRLTLARHMHCIGTHKQLFTSAHPTNGPRQTGDVGGLKPAGSKPVQRGF